MKIANFIAYALVIVGALNWGLFGLLNFNLVSFVFGGARSHDIQDGILNLDEEVQFVFGSIHAMTIPPFLL